MSGLWMALVAFLGASLGSFANVVAYRVPLGRSVVRPASSCPACGTKVPWWGNVPVLGWLLVRGRCVACGVSISGRYPLVELALGLLAVALWLSLAGGPELVPGARLPRVLVPFVLQLVFIGALVALTLIDLDWFLLPDAITLPLTGLGLCAALAIPPAPGPALATSPTVLAAALGAALGALVPWVLMRLYGALTGREGLGGGDWKLLMAIGAWLGVGGLPFVVFAGSLQGLVAALAFRRDFARATLPALPGEAAAATSEAQAEPVSFRRLAVPFGPFLALAAIEWLFFRADLARWWAP